MKYLMLILIMSFLILSYFDKKHKKVYIIFSEILLILYSTFRYYLGGNVVVGNDYLSYQDWFNSVDKINIWQLENFLFNIVMLLVKMTTNSYLTFVFVVECIFIIAMYKYILENSQDDNYILAVFTFLTIGIYELGMSAMRQWMAGSLFLISLKYVKEKNFLKYFVLIFLAGFIHISAWALILVYPFINIDISFKRKTIFFCSLTGLLMILTSFRLDFKFATIIIPNFVYKYPVFDPNLLSNYTIPIISLSCFAGIMVFYKKYKNYSKSWEFELTYLLLLICVSFVATTSMFFGRFLQYFLPALVLIIPNIINMFKGNMNKILKSVAIFFLLAIYIM